MVTALFSGDIVIMPAICDGTCPRRERLTLALGILNNVDARH